MAELHPDNAAMTIALLQRDLAAKDAEIAMLEGARLTLLDRSSDAAIEQVRVKERERCELIVLRERDEWRSFINIPVADVLDKIAAKIRSAPTAGEGS